MKKSAISTTIALMMAMLFVVVAHGQISNQRKMSIVPTEAPPGYSVTISMALALEAGADNTTDMCLYVPVTHGDPVVEPPASFEMEDALGNGITFSNIGSCFTFSDQISIRYRATGVASSATEYRGGFSDTIDSSAEPGVYDWAAIFFEASGPRATAGLNTEHAVLEPTAITLAGATAAGGSDAMPYFMGAAIFFLSMAALFILKRRFAIEP